MINRVALILIGLAEIHEGLERTLASLEKEGRNPIVSQDRRINSKDCNARNYYQGRRYTKEYIPPRRTIPRG